MIQEFEDVVPNLDAAEIRHHLDGATRAALTPHGRQVRLAGGPLTDAPVVALCLTPEDAAFFARAADYVDRLLRDHVKTTARLAALAESQRLQEAQNRRVEERASQRLVQLHSLLTLLVTRWRASCPPEFLSPSDRALLARAEVVLSTPWFTEPI